MEGTRVTIGGEDYFLPPLTLGQLRKGGLGLLAKNDALVAEQKHFESQLAKGELIVMALRSNYPGLDEEKIFDGLNMTNTTNLWLMVLGASGFKPGEEMAATETTKGNGTLAQSIAN